MPMSFPTLESLAQRAAMRGFRQPYENESEQDYRTEFADFMQNIDMVEAGEIRLAGFPIDFAAKHDPLGALSAIMGKSRNDMSAMMDDIFGSAK